MAGLLKVALADKRVQLPPPPPYLLPFFLCTHKHKWWSAHGLISSPQVPDAQAIADALAKDYKSKLEIPYVSAAIAQLHVLTSASASAAGSSPAQLLAAITADPNDHNSRVALAGLMFASGDREAAIDHLLQSIKIDR